ncbi:syndecan-like isoform X2 [Hyposmocoma kahamanoa]|uniref:syndecan-like isoform X2 n=1 Tax=Hyposmocoma kahamanoa TaxID=1477025 RepID=UPI000E6D719B|nr:syndecan-like isoform X2 [Hyposmocoma kahamanoa]
MHLRIYLWLSCVVLAGYVRATEDAVTGDASTIHVTITPALNDGPLASDRDVFIDDDVGSGLEIDGSSGSGWGPGVDDEDARGSARIITGKEPTDSEEGGERAEVPSRPDSGQDISIAGEEVNTGIDQEIDHVGAESNPDHNVVFIMNAKPEDRATSFFAQPGILAAVIGGAVVGLLCAILVVMFIVYRMRKKDEGSYALDEPKRSPAAASYGKGHNNREFYA